MALEPSQERVLQELLKPNSQMSRFSRKLDYFIIAIVMFAVMGAFHIHFMLTGGDWDFWVDWKDRQFWVTVTPIVLMIVIAAFQAIFYQHFRLPIGATLCGILLILGEWLNRYFGFYLWSHFPMSLVWPALVIPMCLWLDLVLHLSRSFILTAIIGALGFALMFPASNWAILAAFRVPIEVQGTLLSMADYIGFTFSRTATPEYLRIIERGTLRTFGGESTIIAAFFSGFVCMIMYAIWWNIGNYIAQLGWTNNRLKSFMGFKKDDNVTVAEGLGGKL
ncbi:MAG: methane monooxygenase/ammonia monooxygenase subunit A [Proteobacteria bacterium]|nr:methane monooxygenase/ammonia monooxygenase subunit A [Pseudomonadota bacterium]